jgi:NADH:ubiquinone oxidoreductase subunit F (NADH-binding)
MTTTLTTSRRLLAGSGLGPTGLAAHVELHGTCAPVKAADPAWSAWLAGTIERSGLTGRGGAAFPSHRKHELVRSSPRRSVLVVNAMEGEPLSVKDQVLLERSPHLVLDGAELVSALLGSDSIAVCIPDDRRETAEIVRKAVAERRPSTTIEILRPPARYVGGEESALVSFVAGGPGLPAHRPDKAIPLTIGRRVALVQNAETLAHVALIARHGPEWFRRLGTAATPGTTLVTVSGHVARPGVHEIELGASLVEILSQSGAGPDSPGVLTGGYGGTWVGPEQLDRPYNPQGVGILAPLPPSSCGLAETARIATYMAGESAGQCGPCVFGLPAIAAELGRLAAGIGGIATIQRIEQLCTTVAGRGACRHPDGVIRFVQSALAVFESDAWAHVSGRPCPGHRAASIFPFPQRSDHPRDYSR